MTWRYATASGELSRDGVPMGAGYSGHGDGLNNPAEEKDKGIGPIPAGNWQIGTAFHHPHLGPCVMHLSAEGDVFGRTGFFIHGDNREANHTASHGCIILGPHLRHLISESGDRMLSVTHT